MNVNEEQNFLNKKQQHLIVKQHFYKSFGKQYGLLYTFNHYPLSQSELTRVLFISYDACGPPTFFS